VLGRTDSRRRLLVVLVVFLVIGACLCSRLLWWQVVQHEQLAGKAQRQTTVRFDQPVRRGTIYDRTGTVVLATSVDRYLVAASPDQITPTERRATGLALAGILGLDPDATRALSDKIETTKPYVVLTRGLEDTVAEQIRAAIAQGTLKAISIEPESVRIYPQAGGAAGTTLAAHLLGFVNRDGEGQYGVEERYQAELAGTPRELLAERDVVGRPVTDTAQVLSPGVAGTDLRLTIDTDLQLAAEQEVLAAYTADEAVSVSAIVMDPATGRSTPRPAIRRTTRTTTGRSPPRTRSRSSTRSSLRSTSPARCSRCSRPWRPSRPGRSTCRPGSSTRAPSRSTMARAGSTTRTSGPTATWKRATSSPTRATSGRPGSHSGWPTPPPRRRRSWPGRGSGSGSARRPVSTWPARRPLIRDPALKRWSQVDLANGSFGQGVAVTELSRRPATRR
jgi:hypothetical protein